MGRAHEALAGGAGRTGAVRRGDRRARDREDPPHRRAGRPVRPRRDRRLPGPLVPDRGRTWLGCGGHLAACARGGRAGPTQHAQRPGPAGGDRSRPAGRSSRPWPTTSALATLVSRRSTSSPPSSPRSSHRRPRCRRSWARSRRARTRWTPSGASSPAPCRRPISSLQSTCRASGWSLTVTQAGCASRSPASHLLLGGETRWWRTGRKLGEASCAISEPGDLDPSLSRHADHGAAPMTPDPS